jgi:TolB-like protein/DNA-binding winged helix-turn-helix (wHTH) protein/Tfp pilus assembly protein PilF
MEKLPMELLILLLERHGELVSRDEIAQRLWGKDVFLDVEHGINVAIRKVRTALRDDPEKPRFVETVVGKGYRFAAPVILSNGHSGIHAESPARSVHPPLEGAAPSARTRGASGDLKLGLIAVAVLAAVAVAFVIKRDNSKTTNQPVIQSLAVLPLKNLSGDPEQEYLADGFTEELIGRLSTIHGLRVISRTSAMGFKDTRKSVPEIAQALHVDAVVEGSVLREGNHVRVRVQLIRGPTDEHIWTDQYQREYRSILALQDEVTRTIAQHVKIEMTPPGQTGASAARPVDPQVYENYLKGRFYFNERTTESLNKSISYFQQAIAGDPNYALAYCGMADAYAVLGFRGGVPSKDALSRAKAAGLKAIDLDPTIGDPHASLAFIVETHEWDWATAEREYKRALELNPGDARTHHWYAGYLTYVGRMNEGIAEENLARAIDPLSLPINNALAGRLLVAGRYDEALAQLRETLQMNPHFAPAHQTLGWAYLNTGKRAEAIQEFQQAVDLGKDDVDFLLDLGFAYAATGNREEAQKILARLKNLHDHALVPSGAIGILYGAMGDLNEAFAWLDKAYAEHDPELTYIKVPNRRFGPLLHDPRYQELVHRIGLPT